LKGGVKSMQHTYTKKQLCSKLGVNINTLEYWRRQGLKPKKGDEGLLVYTDKEVYDFLIKFKIKGSWSKRWCIRYKTFIKEYENEELN
jgi:predicted site-specific integrase-resolvase